MRNTFWLSFIIALFISAVIIANFDKEDFMRRMYESGLLGPQAEIDEIEFEQAFMDFIATYQKSYMNSFEFQERYQVFKKNYQSIANHNLNKEKLGFELRINQFGDLSQEEFKDRYLGLQPRQRSFSDYLKPKETEERPSHHGKRHGHKRSIPASVDWTEQGVVTKIKNQGYCGSCWAFSATGAMESAIAIKTGKLPSLSEQQLVDCSTSFGNEGCNGGLMDWAFEYAKENRMCTEEEYPYKGMDQTCKITDGTLQCDETYHVKKYYDVTPKSSDKLREAIAEGPVSIGVCAEGLAWQFYFRGVVSMLCGACQDHGVLAVGYGHGGLFYAVDYVKIKNSWGSTWGEGGYIRVLDKEHSTGDGVCGIYESPSVPEV